MDTFQKNTSGSNVLYSVSPDFNRRLDRDYQEELVSIFKSLSVSQIIIKCDQNSGTVQFCNNLSQTLKEKGFKVSTEPALISEVKKDEFSIIKHPSNSNIIVLQVGTSS